MSLDRVCYNSCSESTGSSESGLGRRERSLRVWLAGSRSFGVAVLEALDDLPGVEVVVVSAPENQHDALGRSAGIQRHWVGAVLPSAVAQSQIDLIVSAHNYAHISAEARAAATHGAIGYHPSLLPRHRGSSAVEWTVAMADPIAGGTVYLLDDGYDTGPIIAQDFCHVRPGWTASDLWRERLFPMGVRLLSRVVRDLAQGREFILRPQDESVATTDHGVPSPTKGVVLTDVG